MAATLHRPDTPPTKSPFSAPCGSYYDSAADGIASNFGALDLTPVETPDRVECFAKAQHEVDREMRDFLFSVLFSRWTHAAAAALIAAAALALSSCGGGDDQEKPAVFRPAIPAQPVAGGAK